MFKFVFFLQTIEWYRIKIKKNKIDNAHFLLTNTVYLYSHFKNTAELYVDFRVYTQVPLSAHTADSDMINKIDLDEWTLNEQDM